MLKYKKPYLEILDHSAITLLVFWVCTGICFLLDFFKINDLNFLIIYILGILLVAVLTNGCVYSSLLSLISVLGYNFFFTIPRLTLKIDDSKYLVTFFLMFMIGLGISGITFQLKKKMRQVAELRVEKLNMKNEADKELVKATLLRSISHDLRTPLTIIKNGAEVLKECKDISMEDNQKLLRDIIAKSDWTIRLVENLLSMTKIDSEKLTVKKSLEALEEVLPQAVRNNSSLLDARKVTFEMPEELILVPMDATLIIQAVGNILDNAIKYTEKDGNIWIKVFSTGKNVIFKISNDGVPIKDVDLEHIFDMYYTTSDRNNGVGVGIGLAISKLIITAHGGTITARNHANKVVFEFNLPMEV